MDCHTSRQDTIARCEADWPSLTPASRRRNRTRQLDNGESLPRTTPHEAMGAVIVRLLAAGYRHRGGYARFWGTPVTHTLTEDGQ